jgi:hypothetical protein
LGTCKLSDEHRVKIVKGKGNTEIVPPNGSSSRYLPF